MRKTLRIALRMLRRDLRAGDLVVLIVAVMIAVASAVSVTAFTDRLSRAISSSGSEAIGADLVLSSSFSPAVENETSARKRGLETARVQTLRSVVAVGDVTALAEVKAVDSAYPLRGQLQTTPAIGGDVVTQPRGPGSGKVWVDSRLAALLAAHVGDTVEVGASKLLLDAIVVYEPDRGGEVFSIAPRLMMHLDDMPATELIQPGSRARYRLLVKGAPEDVLAWRTEVEKTLDNASRIVDARGSGPRLAVAVERGERFLGLAALVSILLAGAAIARSAQHYAQRQLDAAALMRSVGASQRQVMAVYLLLLTGVALVGSIAGAAIGFGGQQVLVSILPDMTGGSLPLPSLQPIAYGIALGVTTVLAFAAPALLRLRNVPPLRVLKRDLGNDRGSIITNYAAALILMAGFVFWISGDLKLGGWLLAGAAATVLMLALVSLLMIFLVRRFATGSGVSWRYGLASLVRHRGAVIGQTTALGVGVMAMLLLTFVRADLLSLWENRLPPDTPNHFLMGIRADQRDALNDFAKREVTSEVSYAPIIRARLESVNGKPIRAADFDDPFAKRMLQRAANLSWTDEERTDNHIVAGSWWQPEDAPDQVSVEEDYARALGFRLGDVLRYTIADQIFDLRVTSFRRVDWDSFKPNFFLVTPTRALGTVEPGYIASLHVDSSNATYLRNLVREFPNVTDIDVDALLSQVRALMDRLNRALQYLFAFTIAAGLTVLYASVVTTYRDRKREVGVLKTMGARRSQLRGALVTEFGALGLVAGGVGAFAATLTGWALGRFALQLDYQIDPVLWLVGLAGGALLVGIAGLLSTNRVINTPPWVSLRGATD